MPKPPAKKRGYRKKPAYRKKPVMTMTRSMPKTGSGTIHFFERQCPELMMYYNGGSIDVAFGDGTGLPAQPWIIDGPLQTTAFSSYSGIPIACLHRLQDVDNYLNFTSLFDQYRFKYVKMKLDYMNANVFTGAVINNQANLIPEILSVIDYDDATPPTLIDIQQYAGVKVKKLEQSRTFNRSYCPRAAVNLYKSAGTTIAYGEAPKSTWLDCKNVDIELYGQKMYVNNFFTVGGTTNPSGQVLRFQFTYGIEFKGQI